MKTMSTKILDAVLPVVFPNFGLKIIVWFYQQKTLMPFGIKLNFKLEMKLGKYRGK